MLTGEDTMDGEEVVMAKFIGGPMDGQWRTVKNWPTMNISTHREIEPVLGNGWERNYVDMEYGIVRYYLHIFRYDLVTEHTYLKVDLHVYSPDAKTPPAGGGLGFVRENRAGLVFGGRIAPKPDILTDFERWFRWQCFMQRAPLRWVQREWDKYERHLEIMEDLGRAS